MPKLSWPRDPRRPLHENKKQRFHKSPISGLLIARCGAESRFVPQFSARAVTKKMKLPAALIYGLERAPPELNCPLGGRTRTHRGLISPATRTRSQKHK